MPDWLTQQIGVGLAVLIWCAWWLWAVDWRKAWPMLARGGWAPVVLLMLLSAYTWSRIAPGECAYCQLPNFWSQLGSVSALTALALFCGWIQGLLGWAPPEISLDPPGAGMTHAHGHHH